MSSDRRPKHKHKDPQTRQKVLWKPKYRWTGFYFSTVVFLVEPDFLPRNFFTTKIAGKMPERMMVENIYGFSQTQSPLVVSV
jgi:hypothetical protein